jgi:serine/threonine protein kinase
MSKQMSVDFVKEVYRWISLCPHPHIVTAHYVSQIDDAPHVVMEYMDGPSLRSKIQRGPLEVADYLSIALQICLGMRHAEDLIGLVHNDLKPENVLTSHAGVVKVADLGVASIVAKRTWPSAAVDARLGTYDYQAPETFYGQSDFRSDVYSFGVLSYELLTGRPPFSGQTRETLAEQHNSVMPKGLSQLNSSAPSELNDIVMRCLEKKPENRFLDFNEVIKTLAPLCKKLGASLPDREVIIWLDDSGASSFVTRLLPRVTNREDMPRVPSLSDMYKAEQAVELRNKGISLIRIGQYEEAIKKLDSSLANEIELAASWSRLGILKTRTGNKEVAAYCAERAAAIDGNIINSLYNKSIARGLMKDFSGALNCVNQVLRIDSQDKDARLLLDRLNRREALSNVRLKVDEFFAYSIETDRINFLFDALLNPEKALINKEKFPTEYWELLHLLVKRVSSEILTAQRQFPSDPAAHYFREATRLYPKLSAVGDQLVRESNKHQERYETTGLQELAFFALGNRLVASQIFRVVLGMLDDFDYRVDDIQEYLDSEYAKLPLNEEVRQFWRNAFVMWMLAMTGIGLIYGKGLGKLTPESSYEEAIKQHQTVLHLLERFELEGLEWLRCRSLLELGRAYNALKKREQSVAHLLRAKDCFIKIGQTNEAQIVQQFLDEIEINKKD